MADEFAKGLGILTTAGLAWMVLAGWYTTASFAEGQLLAPPPSDPGVYASIGLFLKDALFWFAVLGALTFWVVVPLVEQAREAWAERSS
ncbi:DUF7314 family protein [Halorientalis regularis]|jgi:hypothetical protein|uniref:DUF7314 domain-containing protein n=1 Tax=Halorientalis regularis TaxID=660518 RepID=A0A1G7Q8A5_9EURY|nr:hypothetical protein [Halorientalis regularis]SDF94179.1 hypothetical protein SAMN05216218_11211 [Halorientalis regularis]